VSNSSDIAELTFFGIEVEIWGIIIGIAGIVTTIIIVLVIPFLETGHTYQRLRFH
jgi:hypothetical protein